MSRLEYPESPFPGANFVPPEGPLNATIVIIGEAPGRHEDEHGRPFVGGSGKILNMLLDEAGLRREDIYITNVIKYRPPDNDITSPLAQSALPAWRNALVRELRALRPAVIVPMGNTALEALGFNYKIGRARGAVIQSSFGKVIPTYHPAYIMRQWQDYYTATHDWKKIAEHSRGRALLAPREEFNVEPTVQDIELFARNLQERTKHTENVRIALDLETFYIEESALLTPIKTVGLATSDSNAIVVPFITQAGNQYWQSEDDAVRAVQAIGSILENPDITLLIHNSLFDVLVLMNHGFTVNARIYDTMLAQYLVYHPSRHTLEYLTSIYTDYQPWKLEKGHDDRAFREYNARDCVVLHMMYRKLQEDVTSNGVQMVFDNLMEAIIPTCQMMINGIHIDRAKYDTVKVELEAYLKETKDKLRELSGVPDFNPDSPKQLADVLFKKMKLKSGIKTKSGADATSEDVLNRLALRYPEVTFLDTILEYRNKATQYKTFIKKLPILPDGRVHTNLSMHTAVTGRYSSSNPNMQNLPARKDKTGFIRGMYSAPDGRTIVQLDYSQVELMIFAVLSGDEIWLEAFSEGKDVHVLNGTALMGPLYDDSKYRTFGKNFIYGFIYGSEGGEVEKVAPKELIREISVPQMLKNLAKAHPWLFTFREKIQATIEQNHYVQNAFGRKRWYVSTPTKADLRSAYNFPIQGTAADIMHIMTPRIHRALGPQDKLILQLHDAYYIETDEDRKDLVASMVKSIMEEPVHTPQGHTFNLKAEVEIGASLSKNDMEKWHGPTA